MNEQPAMNDDSTIVMDSAVPSAERNCASAQRPMRSKSDEIRRKRFMMDTKRVKARSECPRIRRSAGPGNVSDEIMRDNTQPILRAGEVTPRARICRSVSAPSHSVGFTSTIVEIPEAHSWRKWTEPSSESSSPEESNLIPPNHISQSMEDKEPWINRDQNDIIRIINLSKKKTFVRIIIKLMYNYFCNLPKHFFFSENQIMSSKISGFIRYFNIDKNRFSGQCGFAVIELKEGSLTLIGPFIPVNLSKKNHLPDIDHSEEQCIREIKKEIKGKEQMIKAIHIFTKLFPCVGRKDRDPCTSQLVHFSEEMLYFKIELYVSFQDAYAIGNIVEELKLLINDKDQIIKHHFLWLKQKVNDQHRTSTFTCFHRNKHHKIHTSRAIKSHIKTQVLESNLLNWKDVSFILKFIIEFPNNEMTLDEFKDYGQQQADQLKTHVQAHTKHIQDLTVSEEITEEVCLLFHRKWCELVYEEYEEFIYEKISDYINSFADKFTYDRIEEFTHLNLERVKLPD